jgi:hypothetical protein
MSRPSALRLNTVKNENVSTLINRLAYHPTNAVLLHTIAARATNNQLRNLVRTHPVFEREWVRRMLQSRNVNKMLQTLQTYTLNARHKTLLEKTLVTHLVNKTHGNTIKRVLNVYTFPNNLQALLINAWALQQFSNANRHRLVKHLQGHRNTPMVQQTIKSFSHRKAW